MAAGLRVMGWALLASGLVAGCGSDNRPASGGGPVTPPGPTTTRFDLANRCFVMKANGAYTVRDGEAFAATGTDAASAERFYMKPTALGRYLFYTADRLLLTGSGEDVSAVDTPEDGSDWTFSGGAGRFGASTLDLALTVGDGGVLALGTTPAILSFEPAQGCTAYPEMPVGIDAPTFKNTLGKAVIGFAEVHSHMGMGSDMSDGTGDRGPSAGGVLYGQAIHRFGVPHALEDCAGMHGPEGTLSAENIVLDQDPTQTHDTVGWPSFVGWPQRDSQLHQQMYYKWVERAYKAGLRTMTIHGTSIEALCNIAKATTGDKTADCVDMGVGTKQVEYLFDIEKYVDAQEGGPGKGWFRIVKDPAEARRVIADGKLAVIPGLEFSNLFHCRVQFLPDGSETSDCTKEDIDREIDEVWELGVRQVFPYHDVDSSLGGTGIFSSVLNYVGFTDTKGFWKTYPCADGGEGATYFYEAGAVMETAPLTQFNDPISSAIMEATGGLLPIYGPGRQCNARTVTDLGKYAIDKLMKKGFILDIDHAEILSKQYMLDEGAKLNPDYPMISGHGGHGGISNDQVKQIVKQGGIVFPSLPNGKDYTDFLAKLKPLWDVANTQRKTQGLPERPFSVGYGADSNGLHNLPRPRGAGSTPIQYPFTLFQGDGWGPQYAAAGIAPLKVDLLAIPEGQSWNMDEVGMAHYGLVADIVEEIRIEGGQPATDALYNSAETFLQLWEQTLAASADARTRPTP
ncbi:MAG TPA: hypothetical protein VFV11_05530 [Solimonas sp.]|nr:hypothetical protein [Solimonas sp.]